MLLLQAYSFLSFFYSLVKFGDFLFHKKVRSCTFVIQLKVIPFIVNFFEKYSLLLYPTAIFAKEAKKLVQITSNLVSVLVCAKTYELLCVLMQSFSWVFGPKFTTTQSTFKEVIILHFSLLFRFNMNLCLFEPHRSNIKIFSMSWSLSSKSS